MHVIERASHRAALDPMTGLGALALPNPADDLANVGTVERVELRSGVLSLGTSLSLQGADWDATVSHLWRLGWEPMGDEEGETVAVGRTPDGREVVGLWKVGEGIIGDPTDGELDAALAEALEALGALPLFGS